MGFDTIEINLIFLVASKMGLVIVLANLASEMKPSLEFFFVCKVWLQGDLLHKRYFPILDNSTKTIFFIRLPQAMFYSRI